MRATQGTTYRVLQSEIQRMSSRLEDLRTQAATGKKVNRPSDDPSVIQPVLTTQARVRANNRYLKTMGVALDKMNTTENHMEQIENIMVRAKEAAIQSLNGGMNSEDMGILGNQIRQIKEELLQTANAQVEGKYIFGGFAETTKPFTVNPLYIPGTTVYDPADNTTWPISYNGDANVPTLATGPGETIATHIPGNTLFLGDADNDGVVDAGKIDLFATLTLLEEAMNTNNPTAITAQLDNLNKGADQARLLRSRIGNNAARIESSQRILQEVQIDMEQILSRYVDADILKIITDITQQETAFEAALNVTAKVSKLSIFEYL